MQEATLIALLSHHLQAAQAPRPCLVDVCITIKPPSAPPPFFLLLN